MTACSSASLKPAGISYAETAPAQMAIQTIVEAYRANPEAADAKYNGQRIYLPQLTVESVSKELYPQRGANTFEAASVTFKPSHNDDLWPMEAGTVVDVVGEIQTMGQFFIVKDCWIKIISGEAPYTVGY